MQQQDPRVLVFVVALNEEKSLGPLLDEIRDTIGSRSGAWELVVVDDGSTDRTGAVAASRGVRVLRHPVNLGIGAAEQTGLLYAKKMKFQVAVRIDGDGQHSPESIADLLEELDRGAHLVIGSRFLGSAGGGFRSTLLRRMGIRYFSLLCFLLSGKRVKDPTSGFRCFAPESISLLTGIPAQDYPEVESFIEASRSGLRVREVAARFRPRSGGESSISAIRAAYFMVKVTLAVLVASLRRGGSRDPLSRRKGT
jgi:glycosyltransferase involved in cell wall biosynthesis